MHVSSNCDEHDMQGVYSQYSIFNCNMCTSAIILVVTPTSTNMRLSFSKHFVTELTPIAKDFLDTFQDTN